MRHDLRALAAVVGLFFAPGLPAQLTDAEIVDLDAVALRAELAAGRLSAELVTAVFLRRIEMLDDAGPTLNAVIEINPDAMSIARALDQQRAVGPIGPLHGVPVLVKANIDTGDQMATTAGSVALAEHRAVTDAPIVVRLRAAGAVLLGKTNLSEWANFRSNDSTSGWSSLGGQTRNPYVLDRNPCGSSSGSAVAVAARLAPLAVGTETDGSIACPAAINGVVGIKPTVGSLSGRGIIPIAPSQDTAGPFARTVADAALLLAVLSESHSVLGAHVTAPSVRGMRLGVIRNYHGAGVVREVETAFAKTLGALTAAGASLVDPMLIPWGPEVGAAEFTVLLGEFQDHGNAYLATVRSGPRTLAELVEFNVANAPLVMPHFGQELLLAAQLSRGASGADYAGALATIDAARAGLAALFASHDLDALVVPANAPAWQTDWRKGDTVVVSSSSFAAISGYPSVIVPVELAGDLPLGVAFVARPRDEVTLIAVAAALERWRGPFPQPRYLPTTAN